MLHTIGSIHYRRLNGKLKYFQHWTFGEELIELLGWKPGNLIHVHSHELGVGFVPQENNFSNPPPSYPSYKLGTYRDRSSLWLNYEISAQQRINFLRNLSNGIAIKVYWSPGVASFSALDSMLQLYGAGQPFRKGVTKPKKRKRS